MVLLKVLKINHAPAGIFVADFEPGSPPFLDRITKGQYD